MMKNVTKIVIALVFKGLNVLPVIITLSISVHKYQKLKLMKHQGQILTLMFDYSDSLGVEQASGT